MFQLFRNLDCHKLVSKSQFTPIFTGQGQYKWDDNWIFTYSNWGPKEPLVKSACILFHSNGFWSATDCSTPHHFVCKQTDGKP